MITSVKCNTSISIIIRLSYTNYMYLKVEIYGHVYCVGFMVLKEVGCQIILVSNVLRLLAEWELSVWSNSKWRYITKLHKREEEVNVIIDEKDIVLIKFIFIP